MEWGACMHTAARGGVSGKGGRVNTSWDSLDDKKVEGLGGSSVEMWGQQGKRIR